jgi:transposase
MDRFVAIDLGARRLQIVIQNAEGTVLTNTSLPARLPPVIDLMRHHQALNARVLIEAGFGWYWVADGLKDAGADVHLAHPTACAAITTAKVKTDKRDANTLCNLLRANIVSEAYLYPREGRALRDLVRERHRIVEGRCGEIRRMRAILYREGFTDHSLDDVTEMDEQSMDAMFTIKHLRTHVGLILDRIAFFEKQQKAVEEEILRCAGERPDYDLLMTIPGIGKIIAVVILTELGDIKRFASMEGFCSYCRVAPGIAQSGGSVRGSRASKAGNQNLKRAFHQAAVAACMHYDAWAAWRNKLKARCSGRGANIKTTNSVAHRLARIAYHMLSKNIPYSEEAARISN